MNTKILKLKTNNALLLSDFGLEDEYYTLKDGVIHPKGDVCSVLTLEPTIGASDYTLIQREYGNILVKSELRTPYEVARYKSVYKRFNIDYPTTFDEWIAQHTEHHTFEEFGEDTEFLVVNSKNIPDMNGEFIIFSVLVDDPDGDIFLVINDSGVIHLSNDSTNAAQSFKIKYERAEVDPYLEDILFDD